MFMLALSMSMALAGAPAMPSPPSQLSIHQARRVAAAVAEEAARANVGGAVAVVDAGGHPLVVERLDGTFPAAATVAIGKARTAATFRRPTRDFEKAINSGRVALAAMSDFTPLQGGVPLTIDGVVVGAVGVSGAASAQQDDDFATAAASMLSLPAMSAGAAAEPVVQLADADVRSAFEVGRPLLETESYKVHASRRDAPGVAEIHDHETDVLHVLSGSATIVTGGSVPGAEVTAPGERRGPTIEGGEARRLGPGDVLVVPAGTPHWFSEVQGPFTYFVVKVVRTGGPQA